MNGGLTFIPLKFGIYENIFSKTPPKNALPFHTSRGIFFRLRGAFALSQWEQVRDIFSNTLVDRSAAVRISERVEKFLNYSPYKFLSRFKQVERYFFKTPDNLRSLSGNKRKEIFKTVCVFAVLNGYSLRGIFKIFFKMSDFLSFPLPTH